MSQKIISRQILIRLVGSPPQPPSPPPPHVYQAPEVAVACAAHAIVAHEALFNLLTYLLRNILKITRIKL